MTPPLLHATNDATRVQVAGTLYCGNAWCLGCDLPAGYIDRDDGRHFVRGPMTARGMAMQRCSPHVAGEVVDLASVLTAEECERLMVAVWG
jgi:hypothetical protein